MEVEEFADLLSFGVAMRSMVLGKVVVLPESVRLAGGMSRLGVTCRGGVAGRVYLAGSEGVISILEVSVIGQFFATSFRYFIDCSVLIVLICFLVSASFPCLGRRGQSESLA